jgi:hypothetical protein
MAKNPPQQAMQWMDYDHNTASVLMTAKRLLAIESVISSGLPSGLSKGFCASELRGSEVTLTANNTAFASKLRQLQPRMLEQLNQAGWNVTDIKIRVTAQAPMPTQKSPPKQARALESSDLKHFETLAGGLRPGPLADAVSKLIKRHKV